MDNDLIVKRDVFPDYVKFTITGRIYSSNADVFEKHLDKAIEEKSINIILNMNQVDYISSIGIRVILKIFMEAKKAGGKLSIEMPSDNIRNILKITALDEMLIQPYQNGDN